MAHAGNPLPKETSRWHPLFRLAPGLYLMSRYAGRGMETAPLYIHSFRPLLARTYTETERMVLTDPDTLTPGAHGAFPAGICGQAWGLAVHRPGLGDGVCAHDQTDLGEAVPIINSFVSAYKKGLILQTEFAILSLIEGGC